MFPDDSILNKMAQQSVELELESTSELAVVVEGYDSADIIVVDDDSKSTMWILWRVWHV